MRSGFVPFALNTCRLRCGPQMRLLSPPEQSQSLEAVRRAMIRAGIPCEASGPQSLVATANNDLQHTNCFRWKARNAMSVASGSERLLML